MSQKALIALLQTAAVTLVFVTVAWRTRALRDLVFPGA